MITTLADLQAALLLGGDVVCDPTVTIDVTGGGLTVALPTRLLGGTFTCTSGPAFLVTSSNVEVSGLSIAGPGGTTYDSTQKLVYLLGTQAAPLTGIDVHNCHVTDCSGFAIWAEWCVDSNIHDNTITTFLGAGIMVISGDGVGVDCNAIRDGQIPAGQVDVYGIAVTDLLNTVAARSKHCSVTGNRVAQIDWEGIDTHGGLDLTVTGNTVTACRRSIALVVGNPTRATAPTACGVMGNIIDATGARVAADIGIFLAGQSGMPASATVSGNHIVGLDGAGQQPISTTNWDRTNTWIGGNSRPHVPWTAVSLTGGWAANPGFPAQYSVDGNTVSLRGGVVPPSGGDVAHPVIGSLPNPAAWPSVRDFYAGTKSSSAATATGMLDIDVDGTLRIDYDGDTASFTLWLTGTYQAI